MICKICKKKIPNESIYCMFCGNKVGYVSRKRANGEGSVYRRGKKWMAEVCSYSGDIRLRARQTYRTKIEAIASLPSLKNKMLNIHKNASSMAALYETYSQTKKQTLSVSKQTAYDIAWTRLPDTIKVKPITQVSTLELQNAIEGLSYYKARDIKVLVSHLYKIAMSEDMLHFNLSENIVLPKLEEKEQEAFSDEDILKFWADYHKGNMFTGYILLMIYTGMMPGELLECKKEMVDIDGKRILGAGKKTATRKKAAIALPVAIVTVLQDLMERSSSDRVYPYTRKIFYRDYKAALERSKVRYLPPYSCRHTTATALVEQGIDLATIQKVMRHANVVTTTRYTHPDADKQIEALETIPLPLPT